jgi:hypothetical protein
MTRVAIRQFLNFVISHKLASEFELVGRMLVSHVENLFPRPDILFGFAMTAQAPVHIERVDFVSQGHQVHPAVACRTPHPLVDMNAVVEKDKIGKVVYARPHQGFPCAIALAHGLQHLCVSPDLRMAAHARFGGWDAGEGRSFYSGVTIPAVDAVIRDVMPMTEGHRLIGRDADVGDVVPAIRTVGGGDQCANQESSRHDAHFGSRVCTAREDLCHSTL